MRELLEGCRDGLPRSGSLPPNGRCQLLDASESDLHIDSKASVDGETWVTVVGLVLLSGLVPAALKLIHDR